MAVFIAMLYPRYIFDCHIKYSQFPQMSRSILCFEDGFSCSYLTDFLCFIICVSSLCSYFLLLQHKPSKSSYGISWRLGNFSPCQWDHYDYPHFTGWEAEKVTWQNALSGRKMLVWMQSYHSQFCTFSYVYTPNSLLRPEGVCMCLGGILS